ncbi:MAG: SDR family oxidoreductase [Planctomycetota bacterium]|jgi:uncharacterized protein YbjT (DUF2867 family)
MRILITGGTGYVGGRLIGRLEQSSHELVCLARRPEILRARVAEGTRVVEGDVRDEASLTRAMQGVDVAYYLVHSLAGKTDLVDAETDAARNFAACAAAAGVQRIVYLGGLGHGENLSSHLFSRQEAGRVLREGPVPVVEFRASVIIGSGSISFALVRALVEKLPIMIAPRWVNTPAQPISIEDVLDYLVAALEPDVPAGRVYEIGGARPTSYLELMKAYAAARGLRRWFIRVPLLTPRLSSLWLALVTPVYYHIGRKLIAGLDNESVVLDPSAHEVFDIRPRTMEQAISRALANEDRRVAETRWSDDLLPATASVPAAVRLTDSHERTSTLPPERLQAAVERIGGERGWYYANWLWRIRGWLDLLVGGVGLRRGRRDPDRLRVGDTLDFWRVESVRPLRLRAEMKLPGRAWLQFEIAPCAHGAHMTQTAIFDPRGLFGRIYWYSLLPLHKVIFRGMLRNIERAATAQSPSAPPARPKARAAAPASPAAPLRSPALCRAVRESRPPCASTPPTRIRPEHSSRRAPRWKAG